MSTFQGSGPIMKFKSRIAGKNADVVLWPDRIEWSKERGKLLPILLALPTGGISLLWLLRKAASTEMVPIRAVSSVTTKDLAMVTEVVLTVSNNTMGIRADKPIARRFKDEITRLMLG